jgi:hypothetical protein
MPATDTYEVDTSGVDGVNAPAVHTHRTLEPQNVPQVLIQDYTPVIPPKEAFAGKVNIAQKQFYVFYDEALLDSQQNTLAMRRDGFVNQLLRHRQLPAISLPHHIVTDDPEESEQKQIANTIEHTVTATRYFQNLKLNLSEALFYGKMASQVQIGPVRVLGNTWNGIVRHLPINGDKLRYKDDGTPGIAIRPAAESDQDPLNIKLREYARYVEPTMLGRAIFLKDPYLRNRFIIHQFEPSDTDYIYELLQSQSVFGLGLRSRFYWTWNLRVEVLSWILDALQRVGANGMLYAFYEAGNPRAQENTLAALRYLVKDNVAAFAVNKGMEDYKNIIGNIEPSSVGYDVMMQLLEHLENIMRQGILGQDLSSQSAPTGMNSRIADLQGTVREDYIIYDATLLSETLDSDLLQNIILQYNHYRYRGKVYRGVDLPFSIKLQFQLQRDDIAQKIQAAQALYEMGIPLDMDDLRKVTGFSPPKSKKSSIVNPQIAAAKQQLEAGVPQQEGLNKQMKGMIDTMKGGGKNGSAVLGQNGNGNGKPVERESAGPVVSRDRQSQRSIERSSSESFPENPRVSRMAEEEPVGPGPEITQDPFWEPVTLHGDPFGRFARSNGHGERTRAPSPPKDLSETYSKSALEKICNKYHLRAQMTRFRGPTSCRYDVRTNRILIDPRKFNEPAADYKGLHSTPNRYHPLYHEIGIALHSQSSKDKLNRHDCSFGKELQNHIYWKVSACAACSDRSFYGEVFAGLSQGRNFDSNIMKLYDLCGGIKP